MTRVELRDKMVHFLIEYERDKLCNTLDSCEYVNCSVCPFNGLDCYELKELAFEIITEVMKNGYIQQ